MTKGSPELQYALDKMSKTAALDVLVLFAEAMGAKSEEVILETIIMRYEAVAAARKDRSVIVNMRTTFKLQQERRRQLEREKLNENKQPKKAK